MPMPKEGLHSQFGAAYLRHGHIKQQVADLNNVVNAISAEAFGGAIICRNTATDAQHASVGIFWQISFP